MEKKCHAVKENKVNSAINKIGLLLYGAMSFYFRFVGKAHKFSRVLIDGVNKRVRRN